MYNLNIYLISNYILYYKPSNALHVHHMAHTPEPPLTIQGDGSVLIMDIVRYITRYRKELAWRLWCSPCNEWRRFKSYPHCKVKGKIMLKKKNNGSMLCCDSLARKGQRFKTILTRCSQSLCKLFHGNIIDFLHSLKYNFWAYIFISP